MAYTKEFEIGKHPIKVELSHDDAQAGSDNHIDFYALAEWDRIKERPIWRLITTEARRNVVLRGLDKTRPDWREELTSEV